MELIMAANAAGDRARTEEVLKCDGFLVMIQSVDSLIAEAISIASS